LSKPDQGGKLVDELSAICRSWGMLVVMNIRSIRFWFLPMLVLAFVNGFGAGPARDAQVYREHEWEQSIGYASAVRVGRMLYLSGQTSNAQGMENQVNEIYEGLGKTLAHFGVDFSCVVKENIYTKDIEALKAAGALRKKFYGERFPAATWVQVSRLFSPEDLLEVELVAILPEPVNVTK
jgi:enamine deaminase RidA (YjgF/YER057c/UK114 family)